MPAGRNNSPKATSLKCAHCGRPVCQTRHTRASYRVDYYWLVTGDAEPCTLHSEEDGSTTTFSRLLSTNEVITCVDCYRRPVIRAERNRRFRPEQEQGGLDGRTGPA